MSCAYPSCPGPTVTTAHSTVSRLADTGVPSMIPGLFVIGVFLLILGLYLLFDAALKRGDRQAQERADAANRGA